MIAATIRAWCTVALKASARHPFQCSVLKVGLHWEMHISHRLAPAVHQMCLVLLRRAPSHATQATLHLAAQLQHTLAVLMVCGLVGLHQRATVSRIGWWVCAPVKHESHK